MGRNKRKDEKMGGGGGCPFGGDLELKILRMRRFSSRFLDNQPELL